MSQKKKIQVSVTLDDDQITWMDKEIADNRFATRSHAIEGFDLVLVNEALNSCVNIFNLYSGFLAYFTPKLAY